MDEKIACEECGRMTFVGMVQIVNTRTGKVKNICPDCLKKRLAPKK